MISFIFVLGIKFILLNLYIKMINWKRLEVMKLIILFDVILLIFIFSFMVIK